MKELLPFENQGKHSVRYHNRLFFEKALRKRIRFICEVKGHRQGHDHRGFSVSQDSRRI